MKTYNIEQIKNWLKAEQDRDIGKERMEFLIIRLSEEAIDKANKIQDSKPRNTVSRGEADYEN